MYPCMALNMSCKLNEACVESKRVMSFTDEQGQPRYMAAEDGKLYVTLS